jgi:hypothetical protein
LGDAIRGDGFEGPGDADNVARDLEFAIYEAIVGVEPSAWELRLAGDKGLEKWGIVTVACDNEAFALTVEPRR